jgi:hypothetical protein
MKRAEVAVHFKVGAGVKASKKRSSAGGGGQLRIKSKGHILLKRVLEYCRHG